MKRYLDPKNDLPFKRIFGEHPQLLKSFLNALMPFTKDQYIVSLEYLPAEQVPPNPVKKDSIVDVKCKDNYGRQFIVEMQMYWTTSFKNRFLFNNAKSYVKQLNVNDGYNSLRPVYALGIINDIFDKKKNRYYHRYLLEDPEDQEDLLEGMEFVMIELPKFKPESLTEKKMAVLWLRFLKEIEGEKYIEPAPELMENEYIRQAIDICEEGAFTEVELAAYDRYWDVIRREKSIRSTDKKEGEEIGLKKGLEEGIEKTKENIVLNCFKNNATLEFISSITTLTQEEIIAMLKKNDLM
jgi:predicted transposase/invertase (TIGR01784 family)